MYVGNGDIGLIFR